MERLADILARFRAVPQGDGSWRLVVAREGPAVRLYGLAGGPREFVSWRAVEVYVEALGIRHVRLWHDGGSAAWIVEIERGEVLALIAETVRAGLLA